MKIIKLFLLVVTISGTISCKHNKYLPRPDKIYTSPYGSYMKIVTKSRPVKAHSGELIAVDSTSLILLDHQTKEFITVPLDNLRTYEVQYARGKNLYWSVPVLTSLALTHGLFFVLTGPLNILVSLQQSTKEARSEFTFKQSELPPDKLYMYSRFPQGLPSSLSFDEIRNTLPE
tara:strand:+ start:88 stop:609 length:522 start_codon:yes stop_codon:yes gene_type:complete